MGAAIGVYSSSQLLDAFAGGVLGGHVYGSGGLGGVFGFCALAAALWWVWARTMAPPRFLSIYVISMGENSVVETDAETVRRERALLARPGVAEAAVVVVEGVAYLKADSREVEYERVDRRAAEWAAGGATNS